MMDNVRLGIEGLQILFCWSSPCFEINFFMQDNIDTFLARNRSDKIRLLAYYNS